MRHLILFLQIVFFTAFILLPSSRLTAQEPKPSASPKAAGKTVSAEYTEQTKEEQIDEDATVKVKKVKGKEPLTREVTDKSGKKKIVIGDKVKRVDTAGKGKVKLTPQEGMKEPPKETPRPEQPKDEPKLPPTEPELTPEVTPPVTPPAPEEEGLGPLPDTFKRAGPAKESCPDGTHEGVEE